MKNRNSRLELSIIPIDGTDKSVKCTECPAACCREGMVLPLTKGEAVHLQEAGTDMSPLSRKERRGERPPFRHDFYRLESACGNLALDAVTGETSCAAYDDPDRPKICADFKMGSYACVQTQIARIESGQDERTETSPL